MTLYFLLIGILSLGGMVINNTLKRKFSQYGRLPIRAGLTGFEVAKAMLDHYGIYDVQIVEGKGFMTDHYNPLKKTVSLSPQIYRGRSIAAAAVAAHECGHAVQHATAYHMLQVRSGLVPLVKIAASAQQFLFMAALMMFGSFPQLMLLVIITFAITTLFSFVTLPVEFDASKRALAWLDATGITSGDEYYGAKDALKWAAMTYVAAALSSLIILVFLITRFMGGRN